MSLALKTVTTVFGTAHRLGATMPKTITTEHQKLVALTERARELNRATRNDLPAVVLAALEAGADPTTDPAVQQAVTGRAIDEVGAGIDAAVTNRTHAFLAEHGPDILAAFGKPFDTAAATLTTAAQRLGDVNLDDTGAVLGRGGDAAQVWAQAQGADKVIQQIQQMRKLLGAVCSTVAVDPRYRLLAIADVPPATFVDDQLGSAGLRPWDAARRGFPLSLAGPEALQQRVTAVLKELARQQAEAAGAFTREYRRTHGFNVA